MLREAMLYEKTGGAEAADRAVDCRLCAHRCHIREGGLGVCRVRENQGGALYTHVYGEAIAASADPIEKKPLYHFLPGTLAYSVATRGCNFQCGFCQNWQISQMEAHSPHPPARSIRPEEIVNQALDRRCASIAYTYTEPTIYFEYAFDTAALARKAGLCNIFVTNGFMTPEAIRTIAPYLDAANVDLKAFNDSFYKKTCHGRLKPVLETIRLLREMAIWVEVTTLIVPGRNDDPGEMRELTGFLAEVDKQIPWHISRFHPDYNFSQTEVTPLATLNSARNIGKAAGLEYIYVGNVPDFPKDTICPGCGETVISRDLYAVGEPRLRNGRCPGCGRSIPGVFHSQPGGSRRGQTLGGSPERDAASASMPPPFP